jgi:hypothetical protein
VTGGAGNGSALFNSAGATDLTRAGASTRLFNPGIGCASAMPAKQNEPAHAKTISRFIPALLIRLDTLSQGDFGQRGGAGLGRVFGM